MTTKYCTMKKMFALSLLTMALVQITGCHRSEDDFDDRPLAQRPHVETVAPPDRKDIFRPGL